ncbi:uncharacterized protein LOC109860664 isoform X1 [Pseudomyrmex gracilis]|uniref:uncharacterized protein LOC109860664 isoform X1 n=1 Tax=Pseudomyrmex gracilis TaxID=219809 RepID=UPI000995A63D|nr:uncharacterized protein LOC109860664 isoform X1 [Pseudomyrmex gracilis]
MQHCTANFAWYLGKFIVISAGMLVLYVGFLRESEKICVCHARIRELLRQEFEKEQRFRCKCAKGMRNKYYPCGCDKPIHLLQDDMAIANEHIVRACAGSRCCARRNSY